MTAPITPGQFLDTVVEVLAAGSTRAPSDKVTASTAGAALATLAVWALSLAHVTVPSYVSVAVVTVVVFVFGYFASEKHPTSKTTLVPAVSPSAVVSAPVEAPSQPAPVGAPAKHEAPEPASTPLS